MRDRFSSASITVGIAAAAAVPQPGERILEDVEERET
jgi:hypothetical protein